MATDTPMQLGMVGLGRMGANIVRRLMRDGHRCVVYDVIPDAVAPLDGEGADGRATLDGLRRQARAAARGWVMVPGRRITDRTIDALAELLEPGDTIIDGGNTYYRDDIRHGAKR